MEVGVVEVVEVVEGDIDIVDLVEATTPVVEVVSEIVLKHIPVRIVKNCLFVTEEILYSITADSRQGSLAKPLYCCS